MQLYLKLVNKKMKMLVVNICSILLEIQSLTELDQSYFVIIILKYDNNYK